MTFAFATKWLPDAATSRIFAAARDVASLSFSLSKDPAASSNPLTISSTSDANELHRAFASDTFQICVDIRSVASFTMSVPTFTTGIENPKGLYPGSGWFIIGIDSTPMSPPASAISIPLLFASSCA
ncbi:hypothetical protein WMP96_09340 [Corynebacterium sp. KPL4035]|uniref:hypothetical protein n=1 Tax=Corynebacterium sp. KPL4035 TaxID=3135441 RepID=UPI0030C944F3